VSCETTSAFPDDAAHWPCYLAPMTRIPSKDEILAWISDHPAETSKRDIAKAFGIKGAARVDLKRVLKELEEDGHLEKRRRTYRDPDRLPPVSVLEVLGPDGQGDLFAKPLEWTGEGAEPRVLVVPREGDPALGRGDRILGRLTEVDAEGHDYEARLIRRIGQTAHRILGVFRKTAEGGRILPIDKGAEREWTVAPGATLSAQDGELVEAELAGPKVRMGLPRARVITRLGDPSEPRAVSLIAIHQHGIPDDFPDEVIAEADAMTPPAPRAARTCATCRSSPSTRWMPATMTTPSGRMRTTIRRTRAASSSGSPSPTWPITSARASPSTARRGCAATPPISPTGWSRCCPTDFRATSARCTKGCRAPASPCGCRSTRAVTRSRTASCGGSCAPPPRSTTRKCRRPRTGPRTTGPRRLLDDVIRPLYAAWRATMKARAERQPLDLDLPERKIVLSEDGRVLHVGFRDRLDAHRVIEEFMVLANVAAAEELEKRKVPLLYRVHEEPSPEKLEALREIAQASGLVLAKGQVLQTSHLNRLLAQAEGTDQDELINMATLRSMTQAYYHPQNFGHFGLALRRYAHFTSPIRRYSDLVVHRALISAHRWGEDGLSPEEIDQLEPTAEQISNTERRSMAAERDTTDRYLAAFLSERVGAEMTGRISGVQRFGAFVKLDETGADGLIPIRSLGAEFFHFDREGQTLMGSDTGLTIAMGQRVTVRLAEAVPITGGLMLELLAVEGAQMPSPVRRARKGAGPRKPGLARRKADKTQRKVTRRRK
jgi:ribonuclease R